MAIEPSLSQFLQIAEVDPGPFFSADMFDRKYRQKPPDYPHHLVAFYKKSFDQFVPAGYLHINPYGDVALVGGGLTDGRAFAHMSEIEKATITDAGGILFLMLRHAFHRFRYFDAFFGYCGDARAEEVDLRAGFVKTDVPMLLVKWNRELPALTQRSLTAQVSALGPF
jgi:hypothetical protein